MINYYSILNLSSGVTCNWCIELNAVEIITLIQGELGTILICIQIIYLCVHY